LFKEQAFLRMRIAEVFRSLQGEGRLTGADSVFIRTSGCNLRCRYCDTPYASWYPEGEDLSIDEIVACVKRLEAPYVVITGGEPMLFAEVVPLTQRLKAMGRHVTIETAGTLYLPVECDLMSISPKLSNSDPDPAAHPRWAQRHRATRQAAQVIGELVRRYDYQVKFVVQTIDDCLEAEAFLAQFPQIHRNRVMLMPEGTDPEELAARGRWLQEYCRQHNLGFCPRKHIEWFGARRGV